MDAGQREADAALHKLELRIKRVYSEAARDMKAKVEKYYKDFARKDAAKRALVEQGKMSQQAYDQWRVGQMMIGKRWEEQLEVLTADLNNADKLARSMVEGYRPEVYAMGHNYATYEAEAGSHRDTSYTMYDKQTVERLVRDNPDLLPPYAKGSDTDKLIQANRQARWNKSKINGAILQGVLQGESIDKIAKRLDLAVGMGARKAVLMARTAMTGAENAGRVDGYKRAVGMGIRMKQVWMATLDNRTRHEHRQLDGQEVEVGEPFKIGDEEIRYPGDPTAAPHLVYNCRCTLIAKVAGSDINVQDPSRVTKEGLSYEEWKNAKAPKGKQEKR